MSNNLIIYSTVDGQTLAICEKIKQQLEITDEQVTIASLEQAGSLVLENFDKILIGASIRYGKHRPALFEFITQHAATLNKVNSAFFYCECCGKKA